MIDILACFLQIKECIIRDAGGGGAGGACAPPSFGISVNPIRTKGGRLGPLYYYVPPPIFLDDAASLVYVCIYEKKYM